MHIASGLRRKRDEIAAAITVYEARIEAARIDLAALERAARLFDRKCGSDETARHRDLESPGTPEEFSAAQREVWELRPVKRQSSLPAIRAGDSNDQDAPPSKSIGVQEPAIMGEVAYSATDLVEERVPDEFFYLNWP